MTDTQRRAAMYSNIRSAIYIAIKNLPSHKVRGPEHKNLLNALSDIDSAELEMKHGDTIDGYVGIQLGESSYYGDNRPRS